MFLNFSPINSDIYFKSALAGLIYLLCNNKQLFLFSYRSSWRVKTEKCAAFIRAIFYIFVGGIFTVGYLLRNVSKKLK